MKLDQEELVRLGMPIDVFLLEADGMTRYIKLYWEEAADGSRPGLRQVAKQLGEDEDENISSLVRACRTVHTRILWPEDLLAERKVMVKRARFLLDELAAGCEFVADDGVPEPVDTALSEAKERANADDTVANLVQALADYADIAETLRDRLSEVGGFDAAMIQEAKELVGNLGEGGTPQPGRPTSPEIELRNRLLALLLKHVRRVRSATQFVFRRHPEIARKFTSPYHRRKRNEARKKKADAETVAPAAPAAPVAPVTPVAPAQPQPATPVVATPN